MSWCSFPLGQFEAEVCYRFRQEIPIEKVVISQECDLVTLMTKVKGRLEVTSKQFSFVDLSQSGDDGENHDFK